MARAAGRAAGRIIWKRELEKYRRQVIQADKERHQQSYNLAMDELGRPPWVPTYHFEYKAYVRKLNNRASAIFARLN